MAKKGQKSQKRGAFNKSAKVKHNNLAIKVLTQIKNISQTVVTFKGDKILKDFFDFFPISTKLFCLQFTNYVHFVERIIRKIPALTNVQ